MGHEPRQYRIVEVIGQGAVGTVYRAEYVGGSGFRRERALKMLRRDARGDDAHLRLRDEARMLGKIRHRAIVDVHDLTFLDGRWTIVMDYISGADIYRILKEIGHIPLRVALEVTEEIAGALDVAYNWTDGDEPLRILHRDLKPSNVILSPVGQVTVVDFGVARSDAPREAVSRGATLGSLGYVAPERIEGRDLPAGDVFSLGVMLYEMIAGRGFGRALSEEQHAIRVEAARQSLETPRPITDLILSMVALDPDSRPTAKLVRRQCDALARITAGQGLQDWAEETLPALTERVNAMPADNLVGKVLTEEAPDTGTGRLVPTALPTLDVLMDPDETPRDGDDQEARPDQAPEALPNQDAGWASTALRSDRSAPHSTQPTPRPPRRQSPTVTLLAVVGGATVGTLAAVAVVAALAGVWWMTRG